MSVAEINTLHTICKVKRTQFLVILAMSVKHPLAGFRFTQIRSNFPYFEGSSTRFFDCPHHLSLLYIADQCYKKFPLTILKLFGMLTLTLAKHLNMLIKFRAKKTQPKKIDCS